MYVSPSCGRTDLHRGRLEPDRSYSVTDCTTKTVQLQSVHFLKFNKPHFILNIPVLPRNQLLRPAASHPVTAAMGWKHPCADAVDSVDSNPSCYTFFSRPEGCWRRRCAAMKHLTGESAQSHKGKQTVAQVEPGSKEQTKIWIYSGSCLKHRFQLYLLSPNHATKPVFSAWTVKEKLAGCERICAGLSLKLRPESNLRRLLRISY